MEEFQTCGKGKRYRVLRLLGSGSYGEVYECEDSEYLNQKVAVKKLIQPKQQKRVGIPQSTVREIGLLREIRHPNVVSLKGIDSDKKGVYLIFEMMDYDLAHFMNKIPGNEPLPLPAIKSVMHQILSALHYLHSRRIFHRDLKPANILISQRGGQLSIKIADFGLSRTVHQPFRPYSPEILTTWYRAPEMCIQEKFSDYSFGVDVWSAGIILLEMIFCIGQGRYGLLRGSSMLEHLRNQMIVLGSQDISDAIDINNPTSYSQAQFLSKIEETGNLGSEEDLWLRIFGGEKNRDRWAGLDLEQRRQLFWSVVELNIGSDGLDLARKMLKFDSLKRIDCGSALNHKFFKQF